MEINIKSLKNQLDQSKEFHLVENGDPDLLSAEEGSFLESVVVDVRVESSGKTYSARGRVKTLLQLTCSRCLKSFTYPIDTQFYATLVDASWEDDYSQTEDDFVFYDNDGTADLGPLVNEIIVTEIPMAPLCHEECQGLCSTCGCDLNTTTCSCRDQVIDPRWEKLKQLT